MHKILVVGNAINSAKIKGILASYNCNILKAWSNDEAYSIHSKEKVSLIITTMDLPGMEAEELCVRLRWSPELKYVYILIVCDNDPNAIEKCKETRANKCMIRPIDEDELLERIMSTISLAKRKAYNVITSVKDGSRTLHCKTVNLSSSGMLIESSDQLDKGACVDLSFFLPESRRIAGNGEVVRVVNMSHKTFQYGIRFADLNPEMTKGLKSFIDN